MRAAEVQFPASWYSGASHVQHCLRGSRHAKRRILEEIERCALHKRVDTIQRHLDNRPSRDPSPSEEDLVIAFWGLRGKSALAAKGLGATVVTNFFVFSSDVPL